MDSAKLAVSQAAGGQPGSIPGATDPAWWPRKVLGPAPGLWEINLLCWGLFLGFLVLPLFVPLWMQARTGAGFRNLLPVDFIYFYGDGQIVNAYSFDKLYDYGLQLKIFNAIFPFHGGAYGPSPYPPFVALFFSLFARFSFWPAYLLWIAISLLLYLAGIAAAVKAVFPRERLQISLIFCFALSFYPFIVTTLANGQLASIAVCSIGLSILLETDSRPFLSGLALSLLTYKPTLLLLLLPMLLLTRRLRALAGFAAGASVLALIATAFAGFHIWPTYAHFLEQFGRVAGVNGQSTLLRWKYVDFSSFSYAVPGGRSQAGMAVLGLVSAAIAACLTVLLWKSAKAGRPAQRLAWASALTWTLLLNVYVPTYDAILVTVTLILTVAALRELEWSTAEGWIEFLAVLIFAVAWNISAKDNWHGTPLLTVLLFVLGMGQLWLLRRAIRLGPAQAIRGMDVCAAGEIQCPA